jgi:hypothetical protein
VLLDSLDRVTHEDLDTIRAIGVRIREHLEALAVAADVRSRGGGLLGHRACCIGQAARIDRYD